MAQTLRTQTLRRHLSLKPPRISGETVVRSKNASPERALLSMGIVPIAPSWRDWFSRDLLGFFLIGLLVMTAVLCQDCRRSHPHYLDTSADHGHNHGKQRIFQGHYRHLRRLPIAHGCHSLLHHASIRSSDSLRRTSLGRHCGEHPVIPRMYIGKRRGRACGGHHPGRLCVRVRM